jgi:hypothetical protein
VIQKALDCVALTAISITAAALYASVAVAIGEQTPDGGGAGSSMLTVIYKNQLHPNIGELATRATQRNPNDKANSDESLEFQQREQWI